MLDGKLYFDSIKCLTKDSKCLAKPKKFLLYLESFCTIQHPIAGLSATFEVGGASARVGDEIDYFLMGVLHKMY